MKKIVFRISLVSALLIGMPLVACAVDNQNVSMNEYKSLSKGVVKWFDKQSGFGFITAQNGDEVFVHFSTIQVSNKNTPKALTQGQEVEFTAKPGKNGLQATNVIPH
jgi:CspA family cold shock protein